MSGESGQARSADDRHLTRETLEAAFAQLERHELRVDPMLAHIERELARRSVQGADPSASE